MNLEGGRARLYSALKTLQSRWDTTEPHWQDTMKGQFVEQVLTPLQTQAAAALEAIDKMDLVLHQMRRDCEGHPFDIYGGQENP
jgi:hypothetical protein